jgi:head-tail adaptor
MITPRLDRRIKIQKPQTSRASDGSVVAGWTDFKTVWAAKKDILSSRRGEAFVGEAFVDSIFTEWTIRHLDGLDGTERVLDENSIAGNVRGLPQTIGRKQFMVLMVEKGIVK